MWDNDIPVFVDELGVDDLLDGLEVPLDTAELLEPVIAFD